ncbi:MAG TPA: hypothetical protein VFT66_06340 [Roseiflexaceae bacterium]|nr:hypothetical protein [Roseiflexaceae bacterium]
MTPIFHAPDRAFRAVAVVALLLSFAASISATQLTMPTDMITVAVLLMMHVVAGISTIALITTLAWVPYDG